MWAFFSNRDNSSEKESINHSTFAASDTASEKASENVNEAVSIPREYKTLYEGLITSSYKFPHEMYSIISNTFNSSKHEIDKKDIAREMYSTIGFIKYFSSLEQFESKKDLSQNNNNYESFFNHLTQSCQNIIQTNIQPNDTIQFNIQWKLEVDAPNGWDQNSYNNFPKEKNQSKYNSLVKRYRYCVILGLHIREKYIEYMVEKNNTVNVDFIMDMIHLFDMFFEYITDYSKFIKSLSKRDKKNLQSFNQTIVNSKVSMSLNMKNNYKLTK